MAPQRPAKSINAARKAQTTYKPNAYATEVATTGVLKGLRSTCKEGATFEHGTIWVSGNKDQTNDPRLFHFPCRVLSTIPDPPTAYDKQRITIFNEDKDAMRLAYALDDACHELAAAAGGLPPSATYYGFVNENDYCSFKIKTSEIAAPLPHAPGGVVSIPADVKGCVSIELRGVYRTVVEGTKEIYGPIYRITDWEGTEEAFTKATADAVARLG